MRRCARLFETTVSASILGCLAALLGYCLWSLDRGLDLTDESYYLSAAINPDAIILWATAMHWLTPGLWRLTGSLAGFRGIGLAILLCSALLMAIGAVRAFRTSGISVVHRPYPLLMIMACSLAGALLYLAFVPPTPSYNLLAASGAYMTIGLVFLTANSSPGLRCHCLLLLAGAALGIAFLAKFSSGVIVWAMACGIAIESAGSHRDRIYRIASLSGAMAATVGVAVMLHATAGEAIAQFRLGALVYMLGAHESLPQRLARYSTETEGFLGLLFSSFWLPLLLFAIHALRPRFWLALFGLAAFCYAVMTQNFLLGGMDYYERQTVPLLAAVLSSLLLTARSWLQNRKAIFQLAVLLLLPFCIAIGSYNSMHLQALFSLAPWGLLVGILAFGVASLPESRHAAMLVCVLFVILATSQVLTNGFRAPYRLHRPLQEQTETIAMPALGTLRVDKETFDSFHELTRLAAACGLHPGQNFLGLYNIPGVALMLQAVPLGFPILQDRLSTEPILEHLSPAAIRSAIVGIDLDSGSYDPGMPKQLAAFPAGYRSCGKVTLPYRRQIVELWIDAESERQTVQAAEAWRR